MRIAMWCSDGVDMVFGWCTYLARRSSTREVTRRSTQPKRRSAAELDSDGSSHLAIMADDQVAARAQWTPRCSLIHLERKVVLPGAPPPRAFYAEPRWIDAAVESQHRSASIAATAGEKRIGGDARDRFRGAMPSKTFDCACLRERRCDMR